jgi:hypothetical protein
VFTDDFREEGFPGMVFKSFHEKDKWALARKMSGYALLAVN